MAPGIEAIHPYVACSYVDVRELFEQRGLASDRFENLMMVEKSVNLPGEDAVTNAVNAARPLVDALSPAERASVELLVVATESGLDFGKPLSTYVHHYLDLPSRCRSFEVKHACYGGTAALQTAAALVAASPDPAARALVVATDAPTAAARGTHWEPSEGAGAVAMLVGRQPGILELDPGASGFHTYEVMDTARPAVDEEIVDPDLSLLAYLSCLQESFQAYQRRVPGADPVTTFDYLAFHTPFAGMVKGAHRTLLRRTTSLRPDAIEADFTRRVAPSLAYPQRVGNLFSAALYLALCSLVENVPAGPPQRVGLFSYGSGCASEFFSGVVTPGVGLKVSEALARRYRLTVAEYDRLTSGLHRRGFGVKEAEFDPAEWNPVYDASMAGRELLVLDRIKDFHREYRWT